MPARRISPFGTASISELMTHSIDDEGPSHVTERRTLFGEDVSSSPVGILQEITNTARRRRHSPAASLCEIWEDLDLAAKENQYSTTVGIGSKETGRVQALDTPSKTAKVRKTPRITSSPPRRKSHSSQRWVSVEQTEYIEHLESELSSLNTKIDALNSPTALRVQSMRVRGLKTQVHLLEYEVAQWERKAEEMVADEAHRRRMIETGLQTRIRRLEDEGKSKEFKLKEFERELEAAAVKLKELHSLESTNRSLERRVDVLTELLANSPTRLEFQTLGPSSDKHSFIQRAPRPRSMISRALSSPCIVESPDEEAALESSPINDEKNVVAQNHMQLEDFNSSQAGTDDRTTLQSTSSRPTSTTSSSSLGVSCFSSGTLEDESGFTIRSRTMRRFPSGACALKPLVLPAAAVLPCLPASGLVPGKRESLSREYAHTLLDSIPASLSREDVASPFSTPVPIRRRRSVNLSQQQALDALEGKSASILEAKDIQVASQQLSDILVKPATSEDEDEFCDETISPLNNKRRSLQEELAEIQEFLASPCNQWSSPKSQAKNKGRCPPYNVDDTAPLPAAAEMAEHATSCSCDCSSKCQQISNIPLVISKGCRSKSSLAMDYVDNVHVSAAFSTSKVGIFTQLNDLINAVKQNPWALGRRILANTWRRASSKLAGLTWWLLGLLFGSGSRPRNQTANFKTDEEEMARKMCCRHHAFPPTNKVAFTAHRPLRESPVHNPVQPSSRRSLRLWLRFSLAIVLAVGIAIKEGPGRLMATDSSPTAAKILQNSEALDKARDDPKEPNLM